MKDSEEALVGIWCGISFVIVVVGMFFFVGHRQRVMQDHKELLIRHNQLEIRVNRLEGHRR